MEDESLNAAFLKRLWSAQERAGLTDTRLAEDLGRSQVSISLMRRGKRGKFVDLAFALRASQRFPELGCYLSSIIHCGTIIVPTQGTGEEGR